jgi:hypothetical protein
MALRYVLTRRPHIGAGLQTGWQHYSASVIDPHVFLHENRVGTFWHRGASKDPNRVAGRYGFSAGPRLHTSTQRERALPIFWQLSTCDGVTIDCGISEGRECQRRREIRGKNAAIGFYQWNRQALTNRPDTRRDNADGFVDRKHRAAECKAVVRQLRH